MAFLCLFFYICTSKKLTENTRHISLGAINILGKGRYFYALFRTYSAKSNIKLY